MRTRKNNVVLSARLSEREAVLLPLNARMANIFFDFFNSSLPRKQKPLPVLSDSGF